MAVPKVAPRPAAAEVADLLDSPEIRGLIDALEETRWTGRPGYPIRTMVGLCLVKSLYALPTWTKTVALATFSMDPANLNYSAAKGKRFASRIARPSSGQSRPEERGADQMVFRSQGAPLALPFESKSWGSSPLAGSRTRTFRTSWRLRSVRHQRVTSSALDVTARRLAAPCSRASSGRTRSPRR